MIRLKKMIWTAAKLFGTILVILYLLVYINMIIFLYNFSIVPD
mgnify:CR=1 FL=1